MEDRRVRATDVARMRSSTALPEDSELGFVALVMGIIGTLVLLVACTNVSALVIGAGVARSQEIAIRLSLGASRQRIIRQLLTESCVLALMGGAAGLALFAVGTRIASRMIPDFELAPDPTTALFALVVSLVTGILFGLSPALHATRSGVSEVLKGGNAAGGASARTRLQSSFVVAQIAVTQPLLLGLAMLLGLVIGHDDHAVAESISSHIVRVEYDLGHASPDVRARFHAALDNLTTLPGVAGAVKQPNGRVKPILTVLPESRGGLLRETPVPVSIEESSPGYFALLDIPLVRGRDIQPSDSAMHDIAVVIGDDMAHELWGNADPLGRRFSILEPTGGGGDGMLRRASATDKSWDRAAVVVGVYDASHGTTTGSGRRIFSYGNSPWRDYAYLVRTTGPGTAIIGPIRDRLRAAAPEVPFPELQTLQSRIDEERQVIIQVGKAAGLAGGLVLLLASIGLYGVIGLAVAQRRREIGIRIALGAKPGRVVGMLFRQGVRLGAIGLLIGLPLCVGALTAVGSVTSLNQDSGNLVMSPLLTGVLIGAVVLTVAAIATWIPARRAAVVDPTVALRSE